jgi:UDP-N-acetylmuramate--alanine ligase
MVALPSPILAPPQSGRGIHFIGIGGTGLSAIARLLLEMGYPVTGSDRVLSPLAISLQESGVQVFSGHEAKNVLGAGLVIRSSAVPDDNPEVQAALAAGIPVLKRADFLGQLMEGRTGIAIAGTHGKTTTTAMIAWMLTALGQDPSYIVGSVATNMGTNAHAGNGAAFVIEADEYDRMFLGLCPAIAVVTNIEHDHPDCFPTAEDYYGAFLAFVDRLAPTGLLLACSDDPGAARLLAEVPSGGRRKLAYSLKNAQAAYFARSAIPNKRGGFDAQLVIQQPIMLSLQVPGIHNLLNALASMAVADQLGLDAVRAAQALSEYLGSERRFQVRAETGGVTVVDDYAHHPTEIRATLAAAKARYPGRRIWVVWQPHTYSRTRELLDDFAASFADADHIIVTDVYAARESAPDDGFSAQQVVAAMRYPDVHFVPGLFDTIAVLLTYLVPGDVLLVLSAGNADQISTQVIQGLAEN